MKPTTRQLIDNLLDRRKNYPRDYPELRKHAADGIRSRRQLWGHAFTRNSESLVCTQRDHLVSFKLCYGLNERISKLMYSYEVPKDSPFYYGPK